jgi:hypothetical protein
MIFLQLGKGKARRFKVYSRVRTFRTFATNNLQVRFKGNDFFTLR